MSRIVALIRKLRAAGIDEDTALTAATVFEEVLGEYVGEARRSSREAPEEERVWVYVMTEDGPAMPLVKVGISKHPNWRRLELEKQAGVSLYIAHTEGPFSARSEALEVEQIAHKALADCHHRGEWFRCPEERAITVVQNISRRGRP